MDILKSAIPSGLKSENGWKANYKKYLQTELPKLLHGTDLQVQPHVMSKMKQWSREYACISSMKDESGSAWNPVEKRIVCSQEMWISHAQGNSGMMRKQNYKWPLYNDWEIIFGKDRANGKGAIDVEEAAKRFIPDIINNANKKKGLEEDFGCNGEGWYEGDDDATGKNSTKRTKTTTSAPLSTVDEGFVAAISQVLTRKNVPMIQLTCFVVS